MAWLRGHMRDHIANSDSIDQADKVLRFRNAPPCSTENEGEAALDLIYQAAEVIRGIEDRANTIEVRAQCLAQDAIEKLQLAENRIQSLETERRAAEACMSEASVKIRETEKALKQAESRIEAAEDQLSQAELRARIAEKRAGEAEKALIRIEDAICTQLLGQRRAAAGKSAAAA
jgi:chromosome segregation ATPase